MGSTGNYALARTKYQEVVKRRPTDNHAKARLEELNNMLKK
jgi:hypothetical protein